MGLSEHPLFGKTTRALLVMVGVLAVPYASPRLAALRVVRMPWEAPPAEDEAQPAAMMMQPEAPAPGEQALPPSDNTPTINNALPAETHAALAKFHPLGRMAEVSDIVEAVLFLEFAQLVTGEILHVDGGQSVGH